MGHGDDVITAISRIHAAGLNPEKWPDALSSITNLIGGHGASLEFMSRPTLCHYGWFSHGLPPEDPYLEYYARYSPRLPYAARQPAGAVLYDAQYCDDDAVNANPFYMEFLAPHDMRYFLGGVVAKSQHELVAMGVQISPKQGHPGPAKIRLMGVLLPHIQQATDVMRRLGTLADARRAFERTLDWLADGVLLLGSDGAVLYANIAAQDIVRANDGISIRRGFIEFSSGDAKLKFGAALKAIGELRDAKGAAAMHGDFLVERRSGTARYSVSVRPLTGRMPNHGSAVALMFIHDPLVRNHVAVELLRQAFGLTPAEADVANGLRAGLSADAYARQRNVSPNTVYTHIRRIREKTGCTRMAELIRKLNDVQMPVVSTNT